MPPSDPETTRWFTEHVQPHASDLRAYLRAKFSSHPDIEDLIQETYGRLLQAREQKPQQIGKAYLFATARNAAIDFFRRQKIAIIDSIAEIDLLPVLEDRPDVAESVSRDQELSMLAEAIQSLPDRCRQVLTLRKIHGLSHRDIACKLSISENTVNAQLAVGVIRLREFLEKRGMKGGGK